MLKRTLTSIALIAFAAVFMVCGYFVSPIFIEVLVWLFLAGATYEMFKCLKRAGYKMFVLPSAFALISSYPMFAVGKYVLALYGFIGGIYGLLCVFFIGIVMCFTIFTFKPAKHTAMDIKKARENGIRLEAEAKGACGLKDLFANIFIIVYPMCFMAIAWVIGELGFGTFVTILFAIIVPILGSDMFAYFFGSLIGGKKLCPKISPKKTVSGAIGGVIGGMVMALMFWLVFELFASSYPDFISNSGYESIIWHHDSGWQVKTAFIYLAIGAACGIMSELGDLAASRIKRAIGIKDYGKIFPGHGGFMDRIDSVMYCLVTLLVVYIIRIVVLRCT